MLEKLAKNALLEIKRGTYENNGFSKQSEIKFEQSCIDHSPISIISEIKFAAPSYGIIRSVEDPSKIAVKMIDAGVAALSVVTQPYVFNGSPKYFMKVRNAVSIPMLMKDIVVDITQVNSAVNMGADCILLMQSIFDNGYATGNIDEFIDIAHDNNMQVLLEACNKTELKHALSTKCDMIGINNRNLNTLKTSLSTTMHLLSGYNDNRLVVSESGIKNSMDIQYLKKCGADVFLIGTSIMNKNDIQKQIKTLMKI